MSDKTGQYRFRFIPLRECSDSIIGVSGIVTIPWTLTTEPCTETKSFLRRGCLLRIDFLTEKFVLSFPQFWISFRFTIWLLRINSRLGIRRRTIGDMSSWHGIKKKSLRGRLVSVQAIGIRTITGMLFFVVKVCEFWYNPKHKQMSM